MTDIAKKRLKARNARHNRIRKNISGTAELPRLCVRRTLKHMIVQIVDDQNNKSIGQISTSSKDFQTKFGDLNKVEQSRKLGELVAEVAKEKQVNSVVFDRGGHIFHGRVKAFAEGARQAGLQF
ncbi:MAG: 50S ribosomal protein L18 [Fibrobacter sp.]|nr:50S ribosomal protein L18 [Fibrobacter sp.]